MTTLERQLADWLPGQRWFAGKGRLIEEMRIVGRRPVGAALHLVVAVRAAGTWQVYQAPVVTGNAMTDALGSGDVVHALLTGPGSRWDGSPPPCTGARPLAVEQSNTSVVVDESTLVKFYRRLAPGDSSDVEVHRALRDLGSRDVAELRGHLVGEWEDPRTGRGVTGDLAMMLRYYSDAVGGWELLRDHRDVAGLLHALGACTARVHRDLALVFGTDDVPAAGVAGRIGDRLRSAAGEVPELAPLLPALSARVGRAAGLGHVAVQRVHGDLHLAQALFTGGRWLIGDFEGEPGAQADLLAGRDNPLRDVAGMLRSFDYLAAFDDRRADLWRTAHPEAFVAGYVAAGGPDPAAHAPLLDAYLVDKAVYEVVYESRSRPDWVGIPLAAVRRMAL